MNCENCKKIKIPGGCLDCELFRNWVEMGGRKVIDPNEVCVCFMNRKTREELAELPDDTVVITEYCDDGVAIVVPVTEFEEWLFDHVGQSDNSRQGTQKALQREQSN